MSGKKARTKSKAAKSSLTSIAEKAAEALESPNSIPVRVEPEKKDENQASKRTKPSKDVDIDALDEDNEDQDEDDDEIDETYSDLDDDQLLELALKDDEPESDVLVRRVGRHRKLNKKNVLYLGHIPHGFYELEIKDFLSQFGKVSNVRVSRSKKTGKSRGYAFIQFKDASVAEIVRKTMHGYILTGRSLVCQHVPEEHVHERMFWGGWSGNGSRVETYEGVRQKRVAAHGKISESEKAKQRRGARLAKAHKSRVAKFANKGIVLTYTGGYASVKDRA